MPIFDRHCHLSPKEIYEKPCARGYSMALARGRSTTSGARCAPAASRKKYIIRRRLSRAKNSWRGEDNAVSFGNPLYHWTHLELQRYFWIYEPLSEKTAKDIWNNANAKIAAGGFTLRASLSKARMSCASAAKRRGRQPRISTSSSPRQNFKYRVIPAFGSRQALGIELPAT